MENTEIKKMIDLLEWFVKYEQRNIISPIYSNLYRTMQYKRKKEQFLILTDGSNQLCDSSTKEYLKRKIWAIINEIE